MTIKTIYRGVITMVMTNQEIVNGLNGIAKFMNIENENGTALLSVKGEYAVHINRKKLMDAYAPYVETLEQIKDNREEIGKLLNETVEIADFRKITEDDFKDGITLEAMQALEFMIL
jgi:hypothetical protein